MTCKASEGVELVFCCVERSYWAPGVVFTIPSPVEVEVVVLVVAVADKGVTTGTIVVLAAVV